MDEILQTLQRQAAHQMRHGIVYQTARTDLLDLAARGLLEKRRLGKTFYFTPTHDLDTALERLEPPEALPGYVVYDSESEGNDSSENSADAP